ncbi:hypothetical protein [Deinococcus metallilatus]|uniref:Uncharacterized protein n=1 Tax=Deinococcus metallilatus TaxID=1211322 RepID=A0ABR6MQF4_9DEIO|nr:hypothetical protein [Deinococcus metallilatus]MBB5293501.1 hypothetical protein [Deinococcus metallilatus]GMA15279.1 hypothetical protein GCM10025871_16100 [Deinococcus metallilatus]
MTQPLRQSVVEASTTPQLSGTVEIGEVYLTAGHQPREVRKRGVLAEEDA